jgi:hypothetical protein
MIGEVDEGGGRNFEKDIVLGFPAGLRDREFTGAVTKDSLPLKT